MGIKIFGTEPEQGPQECWFSHRRTVPSSMSKLTRYPLKGERLLRPSKVLSLTIYTHSSHIIIITLFLDYTTGGDAVCRREA